MQTRMNVRRWPCLAGLLLVMLMPAFATTSHAQERVETDPGYLNLHPFDDWFEADPTLEVNVKGGLLRLVAEASRFEDPDLAELLRRLKAVQVRGYALSRTRFDEVAGRATAYGRRLEDQGWDTVVRTRDHNEQVEMYVKLDGDAIAGMVVMVIDPGYDDTVFLNIVGDIDPEQIGRLGRKFNIGRFEDW